MKPISHAATAQRYYRLGFSLIERELCLRLKIGNVSISAVEQTWRGIVLTFEQFTPRTMRHYESCLPESCSVEQIAGLIYLNIAQNFRDNAATCKAYFQDLGITLFQ